MSSAHRYLDVLDRVAEAHANAKSAKSAKSAPRTFSEAEQNAQNSQISLAQTLLSVLAALEARRPDRVPAKRWQQAVADGKTFLSRWGDQAHALGWTARDLFGLLTVPEHAKPSFNRLSRYDETGLIWVLGGRKVLALTRETAAIHNPSGSITTYRRRAKPALGPAGAHETHSEDGLRRDNGGDL
jgi:hypothetical protein